MNRIKSVSDLLFYDCAGKGVVLEDHDGQALPYLLILVNCYVNMSLAGIRQSKRINLGSSALSGFSPSIHTFQLVFRK